MAALHVCRVAVVLYDYDKEKRDDACDGESCVKKSKEEAQGCAAYLA